MGAPPAETGRFTVLSVDQPLLEAHVAVVRSEIEEAIAAKRTRLVLDLAHASFIDSSGLELLLETARRLRGMGGRLKVVNPNPLCSEILTATRLDRELEIAFDLHQAGRSLK